MEKQFTDNDLIERFLDGSLNEKEREAFQERTKTDTAFADSLAKRKLLQKSYVEVHKRGELKKQIRSVVSDEKRKVATKKTFWLAAASVIVLAAVGSVLIYTTNKTDSQPRLASQQQMPLKDSADHLVQGQQQSMTEYGSADTLKASNKKNTFFPAESAKLKTGDTIWFSWPDFYKVRVLTICNNKGEVVKKESIKQGLNQYVLLPGNLPPGKYTWQILKDSAKIHFTVEK